MSSVKGKPGEGWQPLLYRGTNLPRIFLHAFAVSSQGLLSHLFKTRLQIVTSEVLRVEHLNIGILARHSSAHSKG